MALRNFELEWVRDDGQQGRICQRAENAQRARILFLSEHPNMTEVRVVRKPASQAPPSLYARGLGILAPHVYLDGLPDAKRADRRAES